MAEHNKSYQQILKSTGIFGGSQILTTLIGVVRNKVLAILLGTTGLGLVAIYQTVIESIKSISSLGIETTGVREIATNNDSSSGEKLIETVSIIDKLTKIVALFGALLCILFSYPISVWAFNDSSFTIQIVVLSIAVFFSILATGQNIILHGLRRIRYMVQSTLLWSILGLVVSLPLYFYLKSDGIIPALIATSLIMYAVSYYYKRKVHIEIINIPIGKIFSKSSSLLRIGSYIVVSSIVTNVGYFLIRAFLSRDLGLNEVGLFQAAWTITNVCLMLVLKAMGSDFYPRLCSIIDNNDGSKKLINEQTYVVLILSVPTIIILLISSKFLLSLLYSSEFTPAMDVLNWQILGAFFKIISWPLGFILLAKGKGFLFFLSELVFMIVYLVSSYILYQLFNFDAIGIAYLISYLVYLLLVYAMSIKLCQFKWTQENFVIMFVNLCCILSVFVLTQYYREYLIIAVPILGISVVHSIIKLNNVYSIKNMSNMFNKK